ncbi:hypothetical protein M8C21_017056 [Ambrosia artemisiifolia]|uniref:K-box domain-containing protein n=1 Tax=Ambrosia artemisiifolia TaxID=4212 RepID=A0AAD5GCW0_AMBAR|nr:hypothetical protein M8C21_017056 [Ambrosia artemisiifolia]
MLTCHSMESILERYERYCHSETQLVAADATPRSWTLEYNKLKSRAELLQRNHRHYMGEDIESLSLKEIQNLEQQLDTGLKNIRARKNQLLHESISSLQKKVAIFWKGDTGAEHYFDKASEGNYNQAASSTAADGGEGADGTTNQLDLSLQPIYSCHLRHFPL